MDLNLNIIHSIYSAKCFVIMETFKFAFTADIKMLAVMRSSVALFTSAYAFSDSNAKQSTRKCSLEPAVNLDMEVPNFEQLATNTIKDGFTKKQRGTTYE